LTPKFETLWRIGEESGALPSEKAHFF